MAFNKYKVTVHRKSIKMSNKQKNIISNFYLIREDNTPVYVGYTNRPVKQRFREHLRDKDFTGNVTVEEIDSMAFPFTWDINVINQYANEVSDRENGLIEKYGTGNSVWQKGVSSRVGGQTWADVKHFINTNQDNPKFASVDEEDIIELIAYQKKVKQELKTVISHTIPKETQRLKHIIGNSIPEETRRLKSVIGNSIPKETKRLKSVTDNIFPKETGRLTDVIGATIPKETRRLKSVVGNTEPRVVIRLQNIIGHTIPKETQRLQNIIQHTRV